MKVVRHAFRRFKKSAFPVHSAKPATEKKSVALAAIFFLLFVLWALPPQTMAEEAQSKPSSEFHEFWQSELPSQSCSPILDLLEAVSGKKCGANTQNLLTGVIRIARSADTVEFNRNDGAILIWHKDTGDGARFFSDWEDSAAKIEKQVGESGADYLRGLRSIEAKGSNIEVLAGQGYCSVPFQNEQNGFLKLKSLRLRKLSLTIKRENGLIWIKRLDGVEALLSAGIAEVPIQLREFCRRRNEKGDTVLTFGLSTPFLSPLRALLIVPDAFRISFVIKKGTTPQS